MDNQQAKFWMDMGWLVGFIEGEGNFSLQKQVYKKQKPTLRPRISFTSTDMELSERGAEIVKNLGVGVYFVRKRFPNNPNHKEQLEVTINGVKRCLAFLTQIVPHMTDSRKKRVAKTLQEFCEYRLSVPYGSPYTEIDFQFGQRMRDLNGYHLRQSFRDSTRDVFTYNTKVESSLA